METAAKNSIYNLQQDTKPKRSENSVHGFFYA